MCNAVNFFSYLQIFVQRRQRILRLCAQESVAHPREASHSATRAPCSIAWCPMAGCKEEVRPQKSCIALLYYCNGSYFDRMCFNWTSIWLGVISKGAKNIIAIGEQALFHFSTTATVPQSTLQWHNNHLHTHALIYGAAGAMQSAAEPHWEQLQVKY